MGLLIYYIVDLTYLQVSLTFHDQPWLRNIKWKVTEIKQSISFKLPAVLSSGAQSHAVQV